ncbi:MAG TPA: glycine cleavage system protein H [Vicinamibacterales bacterium]|nr:glycine cleavage system protein H [Vicinamibacterales bacterium]
MQGFLDLLHSVAVFFAFLAARFALLLVVLAGLTVVFLVGLAVVRVAGRVRSRALGLTRVGGLVWRPSVFYTPGHGWLQAVGPARLRVGLDDLAQHVLSRITRVSLPKVGQVFRAGDAIAVIHAGRRQAIVPAPVGGRVVAVNRGVVRNPRRLHTDPYARGWLYAIEPADDSYTRMPSGEASRKWFSAEAGRFSRFIEGQLGLAAADGGELVAPGPSLLSDEQWHELIATFLQGKDR